MRDSYYRARYYDPILGRFVSEDTLRFNAGMNFYGYVDNHATDVTDPSGQQKVHGNWCGPDWTGGKKEQFDPARAKDYKKPKDGDKVDDVCMHHDICYYDCRRDHPCDKEGRRECMKQCDAFLVDEMPKATFWGQIVDAGIFWHPPDPGDDAPSCTNSCSVVPPNFNLDDTLRKMGR